VAVAGHPVSLEVAADVLGDPVGRLLGPLREALDHGLIVFSEGGLVFDDERARDAVYGGIAEPLRLTLHREIGASLLRRGGLGAAAARHFLHGARTGDRLTLECLDRVVVDMMGTSPAASADLALRAVELTETDDDDRLPRTGRAVEALVAAGRLSEATDMARGAIAQPAVSSGLRARLQLTLASVLCATGYPAGAVAEAEAVLAEPGLADTLYTGAELARLLGLLAQSDLRQARARAEAILGGGDRPGSDSSLAAALTTLSFIAWDDGRVADSLGLVRAAIRRSDQGPAEGRRIYPRLSLAARLCSLGELDEAELAIDHAAREIAAAADIVWAVAPPALRARLRLAAGRLDEAAVEAERAVTAAEASGALFLAPLARATLATVALRRDDLREASQHLRRIQAASPSARALFGGRTYGLLDERLAHADTKASRLTAAPPGSASVPGVPHVDRGLLVEDPTAAAFLVRRALEVDDSERAGAVVACAEAIAAEGAAFPSLVAAAAYARGILDRDCGALELAAAEHPYPWAAACAAEDAGVVRAESGHRAAATGWWEQALARFEEIGATRDVARLRARLREAGVRRRHWRYAERPVAGWGSITDAEMRIAELVAEGLTNPQVGERVFLSRHTVDFHLRQIFRKLDISSRVELTRLVLERQ
jgi:DNA-binding CsgD family transcriptional regulator